MIKIFEAFAGYGTASFALKQLNIKHELVGFSEIDKYAIQCFEQNHGGKNFGDIKNINWNKIPEFDLLTGGFSCQPFSLAGKGLGVKDNRGELANYLTKALIVKQPKYFMFENVKGFMSKKFIEFREILFKDWEDAGYNIFFKVLNTRNFGVPQYRERVFIIGIRKDLNKDFKFPEEKELKLTIKDLLENEVNEKYFLNNNQLKIVLKNLGNAKTPIITHSLYPRSCKNGRGGTGHLKKEDGTSYCLDTGNCQAVERNNNIRKLTPTECFRLMGFLNDEIKMEGLSNTQRYKLAGNGWDINLVSKILKEMFKK